MSESSPSPPVPSVERRTRRARALRVARRVLGVAFALLGISLLGPLALLVVVAETTSGRLVGVLAIVLISMILLLATLTRSFGHPWLWAAALVVLSGAAIAVVLILYGRVPPGTSTSEYGLQSYFVGPMGYRAHALLNMLPEIDQVKLGVTIATRVVPWMDRDKARRIRAITLRLDREIESDPTARGARLGVLPRAR